MSAVKASDLAARMTATATHTPPEILPAVVEAQPPIQRRRRSQAGAPARFTFELSRPQHRFVKRFALEADIDASSVARALFSILEEDHALRERVLDRVLR